MKEMNLAGVPLVFHETQTNGIGYVDLMFDLSGVREDLPPLCGDPAVRSLGSSTRSITVTENCLMRSTAASGGIGTSLELYKRCDQGAGEGFPCHI